MRTPYILDDVTFEKYLRAVLEPKENILWPESCPEIMTPPFEEAERLYLKHNPQHQGHYFRQVNDGYFWIWNGFKEEVASNALNLNVSERDRERYLKNLSDWFSSLESERKNYQLLLDALNMFQPYPITDTELSKHGEAVSDYLLDYVSHGEGTTIGRAKVGLEWCIEIIEEGKKIVDNYLEQYIPALSITPASDEKPNLTDPYSDEEKRRLVQSTLAPLSGLNPSRQTIMSRTDFDRLIIYTDHLVLTNTLPAEVVPFAQTGISNEHIRFTFYRLHKQLFGRKKRRAFIDFLHTVFTQFSGTANTTTLQKFSTPPKSYYKDFGGYIGEVA